MEKGYFFLCTFPNPVLNKVDYYCLFVSAFLISKTYLQFDIPQSGEGSSECHQTHFKNLFLEPQVMVPIIPAKEPDLSVEKVTSCPWTSLFAVQQQEVLSPHSNQAFRLEQGYQNLLGPLGQIWTAGLKGQIRPSSSTGATGDSISFQKHLSLSAGSGHYAN